MPVEHRNMVEGVLRGAQYIALALVAGLALAALGWTLAAATGAMAWMDLSGPSDAETAPPLSPGMLIQCGATLVLLALCAMIPACLRVMSLERAHRDFTVSMEDVARAYATVHGADRAGLFTLHREFDSIRERLGALRAHPALRDLEPEILDLAAQMSHESRDLARAFSAEAVSRARRFLGQRQEEAARFEQLVVEAQADSTELRQWLERVELDESVARSRLQRLRGELDEILPRIGLTLTEIPSAEITPLRGRHAAE